MDPISVLVIDDHPLAFYAIKEALTREYPGSVFVSARNAAEGLDHFRAGKFDLIILDLSLGGRSGLEVLDDIRHHSATVPVLIMSAYPEQLYGVRSLRAGASGYLRKDAAMTDILYAVSQLLAGKKYISSALAQDLAMFVSDDSQRPAHERLSRREFEVLCLIGKGFSVKQIASQLNLSIKTVSTYRTRILTELNLDTTAALIRFCLEYKLLDDELS